MTHPYLEQPDYTFWRRSISDVPPNEVDPVVSSKFLISKKDKVATAGSCFAQHIARFLKDSGFNYFVTEPAHPIATPESAKMHAYGDFTARYGNIYTSRQLLQLFDRAYGKFVPADNAWETEQGRFIDPFRQQVQPSGFSCIEELELDREQHFAAVRRAFEELDVFVFTLGLTETWESTEDGAVYPICPGVNGSTFDAKKHHFVNLTVDQVTSEMTDFIAKLRSVNREAKVILTVSPVPLIATALDRHVLVSTTYSKSVLRVAAENIVSSLSDVFYFPSYEIITGDYSRGRYFAKDCRSVLEQGVRHVMRLFMEHYTNSETEKDTVTEISTQENSEAYLKEMERLVEVNCDEEALER